MQIRHRNLFARHRQVPPERSAVLGKSIFQPISCQLGRAECSIDVNQIDRQGLAGGTNIDAVIRAMSTVRKFDPAGLQDLLNRTGHVRAQERARIFKLVLGYVCDYNKDIKADVILDLQTKTSEERQMVLSAVETFREEGREEGLEEGRVEVAANLLQEGMNSEEVVKVTSLSRERVETILHRMNGDSKP